MNRPYLSILIPTRPFVPVPLVLLAVLCLTGLTACDSTPVKPPELISAATIAPGTKGAQQPTGTSTPTPTATRPTDTPTLSPTAIVITATPTYTASVTSLPSFTPTSIYSATPTASFTSTKRATRTPSPTAPTLTFTPQTCTINWFFSPRPNTCPLTQPVTGNAAYQKFEHGAMIWFGPDKVVYTVYGEGKKPRWNQFPDEYTDGMPDIDPSLSAPQGMAQPIRGFGLVWRSKPGMRDRLGWATGPETPYNAAYQVDSVGNRFLQIPTGEVYELIGDQSGWQVIAK